MSLSGSEQDTFLQELSKSLIKYEEKSKTPEQQQEDTRSRVTWCIVIVYFGCIAIIALLGMLYVTGILSSCGAVSCEDAIAGIGRITEYVHMLAAPVVMLVLGFYFGNNNNKKD